MSVPDADLGSTNLSTRVPPATHMQEEDHCSGGGFVRRMSALARKGRSRAAHPKRDVPCPSPPPGASARHAPVAASAYVNVGLELWHRQRREWKTPVPRGSQDRRGHDGGQFSAGDRPQLSSACNKHGGKDESAEYGERADENDENGAGSVADNVDDVENCRDDALEDDYAQDLYNELLAPQYTPFPKRIALAALIPVLLDVWEHDGLIG
jgi:Protein of unknown function (DUF4050)